MMLAFSPMARSSLPNNDCELSGSSDNCVHLPFFEHDPLKEFVEIARFYLIANDISGSSECLSDSVLVGRRMAGDNFAACTTVIRRKAQP